MTSVQNGVKSQIEQRFTWMVVAAGHCSLIRNLTQLARHSHQT